MITSLSDSLSDEEKGIVRWSRLCKDSGRHLSPSPPTNTITCDRAANMSSLEGISGSTVVKPVGATVRAAQKGNYELLLPWSWEQAAEVLGSGQEM